jgi:2-phospho-L-lactate/phosphoenolpyruvate guanylyltransferase
MDDLAIIVPVRSLANGKTRLDPDATPELRESLTGRMLRHVLATAVASEVAGNILLVSPDDAALAVIKEFGEQVTPIQQPVGRKGLNPAIDLGREAALDLRAAAMLVLFADLPWLRPDDLRQLAIESAPVVVATDRAGTGTNALRLRLDGPGRHFAFKFGEGSAAAHHQEAARLGLQALTVALPGTGFDLDTPDDLREFLAGDTSGAGIAPMERAR